MYGCMYANERGVKVKRLMCVLVAVLVVSAAGCDRPTVDVEPISQVSGVMAATQEAPVGIEMRVPKGVVKAGEVFEVSVALEVAAMHEIHEAHAARPYHGTRVELVLPAGFEAAGEWVLPAASESMTGEGPGVYIGRVVFTRKVRAGKTLKAGRYEVGCVVGYQACSETHCLKPVKSEVKGWVRVEKSERNEEKQR